MTTRDRLLEALCLSTPPCQEHLDDLCEILPVVEQLMAERAAEELRAAAEQLHVLRFNADANPQTRWPSGSERVTPDSFYRGIVLARLALRARAAGLTDKDGQR